MFSKRYRTFWFAFSFELGLSIPALMLCWFLHRPLFADAELNLQGIALGIFASLPMLAVFLILIQSRWPPLMRIQEALENFVRLLFTDISPLGLLLISVAAGIGEETLFRSAIQGHLGDHLPPPMGLILGSLLFGLCHFITPAYAVIATFIGFYLGLVWNLSHNLIVPITAHAFYDFVALYLYQRRLSVI